MGNIIHFASVKDGAIIQFLLSTHYFMKVCTRRGEGAVVDLRTGELLTKMDLETDNLGICCKVVSDSLDQFIADDEK